MAEKADIVPLPLRQVASFEGKHIEDDQITPVGLHNQIENEKELDVQAERQNVRDTGNANASNIAPTADIEKILDRIMEMTDEEAIAILRNTQVDHADDPNFPSATMDRIHVLLQGYKLAGMAQDEWSNELRSVAAMMKYHSPYPEVRSVTEPFDDPSIPVETLRAYILGLIFMAGSTAINTFFSPRQPSINLSSLVLQCLLAPCGLTWAKIIPDWGFSIGSYRLSLNHGPWTFKEQIFATIMIGVGNSAGGTYYTYLVQMLPQYLGQTWVSFGYELCLALYAQMAGLGFAGVLRRFLIYPPAAIWPSVLPTLALNKTLVTVETKGEVLNGWRISRYRFFMIAFVLMFVWFWIPNTMFQALRGFSWMTWIAPQNYNLMVLTGFYGGLGINPWATFDWNVSGHGGLVTPFFSMAQQYMGRLVSAGIILGIYYSNYKWTIYLPINTGVTFDNKGQQYNVSRVMGDDGYVNVEAYKEYSPPYFGAANLFGNGALPAWYALTLTYITIRYWSTFKSAAIQMWRSLWKSGQDNQDGDDSHLRMMRAYKEVPDWWYALILVASTACGIAAISAWPTHTPWWSLIVCMVIGWVFLIPTSFIAAVANASISLDILFKILCGLWFPGNPMALLVLEAIGPAFDAQTDTFLGQQKIAFYAKLPPRAVFRGMVISVLCNTFIFIGVLNWMVNTYNKDGTLCTWSNPQHFTCTMAVQDFTSAVMYGLYGTRNMYKMYPILPYVMPIGALVGTTVALLQKYSHVVRQYAERKWSPERFEWWNYHIFYPVSKLYWFNPAIFWTGACASWTGSNLSYYTNTFYVSFISMFYIKRRYPAWWEKYNFILEAGFDIGVAVSGTIQTLAFAFSGKSFPKWWGNTIQTKGVDWLAYNQKAALKPLPSQGFFGPGQGDFPLRYPKDLLNGSKGVRQ